MSDWNQIFIQETAKLITLAKKGVNQEDEEIKSTMSQLEQYETQLNEFLSQDNIKAANINRDFGDEYCCTFDETKFSSLNKDEKLLIISALELQLIGYYVMSETTCDSFIQENKCYEKMLSLV